MPESLLHKPVLEWYRRHARDLPWRRTGATPWEVLVSEVMLQQTPVVRVLPAFDAWITRWPTPASLAADRPGEAVRMWGRLGYPRRALRLHQAATVIDERHDGQVPSSYEELRALPGIGEYTATAVLAFAFGARTIVLDTNVRRVLARVSDPSGRTPVSLTQGERARALALLPDDAHRSATWNVAVMELGALLCTARTPLCTRCPVASLCAWRLAGCPEPDRPGQRVQTYTGTDRQCRGRLLAALRASDEPVPVGQIETAWDDAVQRERALASLLDDGLVVWAGEGSLALP